MQWLVANVPLILSIVGALIGCAAVILHALHKDSVASELESVKAALEKLQSK